MDFILQPQLNMMCIWYVMLILKSPKAHRRRCRGNASIFLHLFAARLSMFFFCSFWCSHFCAFVCMHAFLIFCSGCILCSFYIIFLFLLLFPFLFHFIFSSFCLSHTQRKRERDWKNKTNSTFLKITSKWKLFFHHMNLELCESGWGRKTWKKRTKEKEEVYKGDVENPFEN